MFKKRRLFLPIFVGLLFIVGITLYLARPMPAPEKIDYGITFSKPFAEKLGLDWKKLYTAILDDLGARKIRLPAYWDEIESVEGVYDFENLRWQVREAEKRNAEIILAVGRKLPRWPECHIPSWIAREIPNPKFQIPKDEFDNLTLNYIKAVIERYKNFPIIKIWQVENEPFLPFGECPKLDKIFFEKEIDLVRSLDSSRPILLTDSGEFGRWLPAVKRADIFGTTMYFQVYNKVVGYFRYPIGPGFFRAKSRIADLIAGKKPKLIIEFQMEPWNKKQIYETSIEEQLFVFPESDFEKRVEFARKTGFDTVYLWGAEWWWWMGVKHDRWGYWKEARALFQR